MTNEKARGTLVPAMLGAAFVMLAVVPSVISLSKGEGAVCIAASSCPLAPINPCLRQPSFALVGRCAIPIR